MQPSRWYPDTVAQSWPLLWGLKSVSPSRSKATWRKAIAPWQEISAGKTREPPSDHWAHQNVDEDGFWWPAVSVAAQCVGDPASAKAWVARARKSWMKPEAPFDWPFQVSDLLWLLWMAEPIETHMAPAKSRPSSEFNVDQQLQGIAP